jgi:hypothetical protein
MMALKSSVSLSNRSLAFGVLWGPSNSVVQKVSEKPPTPSLSCAIEETEAQSSVSFPVSYSTVRDRVRSSALYWGRDQTLYPSLLSIGRRALTGQYGSRKDRWDR